MTTPRPFSPPSVLASVFATMRDHSARLASVVPAGGRIALLRLDLLAPLLDQPAALNLLLSLLSPAEAAIFAGFRFPKRRLEWLGGRLAGKHCLARMSDNHADPEWSMYGDLAILPDDHGRPQVLSFGQHQSTLRLSISHSGRFAAALAVKEGPCGLDIQQPTPRLFSVQERFATTEELMRMEGCADPLTRLTALWAIKEAVKKGLLADQPTFLGRIKLTACTATGGGAHWTALCAVTGDRPALVRVGVVPVEEYCMAALLEATDA